MGFHKFLLNMRVASSGGVYRFRRLISPIEIHQIFNPYSYGSVFDFQRALSPVSSKKADPSTDLKVLEFTA